MTHSTKRDWTFFRQTAREMLWPKIDTEYQQELQGIAEGLNARTGSNLDVYDIVAMNAFEELPDYYVPWLNKREKATERNSPATLRTRSSPRCRKHPGWSRCGHSVPPRFLEAPVGIPCQSWATTFRAQSGEKRSTHALWNTSCWC